MQVVATGIELVRRFRQVPVAADAAALAREVDFVGEIAWNRRLSVDKNPGALNPNATRDATNIRMVFEPKYRQVLPGAGGSASAWAGGSPGASVSAAARLRIVG